MRRGKTALVTGAGGFIGHHVAKYLVGERYFVRGVDLKHPEYEDTKADEFLIADLRDHKQCLRATKEMDEVYYLAADMGGYSCPLNLGTDELVTIDGLVDIIAEIAGKSVIVRHDRSKPQGGRGRNSDNSRLRNVLSWEPKIPLRQGLVPTYRWIEERVAGENKFSGIAAE